MKNIERIIANYFPERTSKSFIFDRVYEDSIRKGVELLAAYQMKDMETFVCISIQADKDSLLQQLDEEETNESETRFSGQDGRY